MKYKNGNIYNESHTAIVGRKVLSYCVHVGLEVGEHITKAGHSES